MKIHILNAQAHALHQPHPGTVQQGRHHMLRAFELLQ